METATNKAELIASKFSNPNEPAVTIILILTITKIILDVILLAYKCYNTTSGVNSVIRNPSFASKLILARVISRHCRGMNIDQRKLRREILNINLNEVELVNLIQECQNPSINKSLKGEKNE